MLTTCECLDLQDLLSFFADFGKRAAKIFFNYRKKILHMVPIIQFAALTDVRGISGRISGHDVSLPLRYHQMVDG